MATTVRVCLRPQGSSICLLPCMCMKPRGVARRECVATESFPSVAAIRAARLHRARRVEPSRTQGAGQVRGPFAVLVSDHRHRHWMAHVSLLALACETWRAADIRQSPNGMLKLAFRRGSSVVEQPIRNRQVVGSTPTLGSSFPANYCANSDN